MEGGTTSLIEYFKMICKHVLGIAFYFSLNRQLPMIQPAQTIILRPWKLAYIMVTAYETKPLTTTQLFPNFLSVAAN